MMSGRFPADRPFIDTVDELNSGDDVGELPEAGPSRTKGAGLTAGSLGFILIVPQDRRYANRIAVATTKTCRPLRVDSRRYPDKLQGTRERTPYRVPPTHH